jgi:hypothetical protein
LAFCSAAPALAAAPEAWDHWARADSASTVEVDHSAWSSLLERYVESHPDGVNRFAYGSVSGQDRSELTSYLDRLSNTCVTCLRKEKQRAYWINLYNALTIQTVLGHYPVESIRDIDISPGFFSQGPWGKKLITIEGVGVSLDDIEHRILRPLWSDPRTHYAVNCASIGCPNLMPEAYTASNMEALLDAGARAYVNHARGASIEGGDLAVSSIYSWFVVDFGDSDAGVIAHLKRYAEPELASKLARIDSIDDHDYDWSLNEAPR